MEVFDNQARIQIHPKKYNLMEVIFIENDQTKKITRICHL